MLTKWKSIFSTGPSDLGYTTLVEHEIKLTDDIPFKQPIRRIPPSLYEEIREHLKELLDSGAIRESNSHFPSNVVLVRKSDGSLSMCIYFRALNKRTVRDAHSIPRIEETLDCLAGNTYFSRLDLPSAYLQCNFKESDRYKAAFNLGPLGVFECTRLPFGLSNACATFQRLMEVHG